MPNKTRMIPALEARTRFGQIMKDVESGRVRVLVEKSGVPMVAIISVDEFRKLIAERETRFEVVDRIGRRVPLVPDRETQEDVRAVLKHVRRGGVVLRAVPDTDKPVGVELDTQDIQGRIVDDWLRHRLVLILQPQ